MYSMQTCFDVFKHTVGPRLLAQLNGAEFGHLLIWLIVVFIWLSINHIPTSLIRLWLNLNCLINYWFILSYYVYSKL